MWKRLSSKSKLAVWVATACAFFLVLLLIIYGFFSIYTSQSVEKGTVTFTYGVGLRRDPSVEGSRGIYMPNGVPYANFTLIARAYPFYESGDENEIRYLIKVDDGVYDAVTFYFNSRKATVNGMHITLPAPVKRYNGGVMVPCDFIASYMDGISLEITEEKIRVIYEENGIFLKPAPRPITPIDPNSEGSTIM